MVDPKLLNERCIITPHLGEMERILSKVGGDEASLLATGVTIILKGEKDRVFNSKNEIVVEGGNAGMTKGGTGDVLAGLVAGLYAFSDEALSAAVVGSYVNKKAGEALFEEVGPFFKTSQLAAQIPAVLRAVLYR
jgi:ADP-dependent NAD(P)H-hydrate dehydratase / NAD(P)H-hydrate epimerase